jgi:hypothetical protein
LHSGQSFATPITTSIFIKLAMGLIVRMFREGEIGPKGPGIFGADDFVATAAR